MATYNDQITRANAAALIPEEVSKEIIQGITETSHVMRMATRLPNMSRAQLRLPILSALPTAYFINPTDTGLKQTTDMEWANKFINAEEIACIVPIPETVLDDVDYDIWAQIRPLIIEAFGIVFDNAVLHGTNAPATWPTDLFAGALSAGNNVVLGTGTDLYDDLLSTTGVWAQIEEDGFSPTASLSDLTMKAQLRSTRDADGNPIFSSTTLPDNTIAYNILGTPQEFPMTGILSSANLSIAGQWNKLVYAMRQDMTWKILDQAVIQDGAGNIIYNLAQQDMVALRAVMRTGWQLPNPINRVQAVEANRYPFGTLTTT